MKKHLLINMLFIALAMMLTTALKAQEEEEEIENIELIPADMEAAPYGQYYAGTWSDPDGDGIMINYDKCSDEYDDTSYRETGTQQDYYYHLAAIFPVCDALSDDPKVDKGYIGFQLEGYRWWVIKHRFFLTCIFINGHKIQILEFPV